MPPFQSPSTTPLYKPWYRQPGPLVLLSSTVIFTAGLVWLVAGGLRQLATVREEEIFTRGFTSSTRPATALSPDPEAPTMETTDNPTLGPANAPVVIVEFGDFECPYCRDAFPIVRELINKFEGKVRWQWRHFPLSDVHTGAIRAAEASECAAEQGNFWGYHDKLFLNQPDFSDASLVRYALQIGLDQQKFNTCLASEKYKQKIQRDYEAGLAAGVGGTPTFFINSRKVPGVIPREIFAKIITRALPALKVP